MDILVGLEIFHVDPEMSLYQFLTPIEAKCTVEQGLLFNMYFLQPELSHKSCSNWCFFFYSHCLPCSPRLRDNWLDCSDWNQEAD